MESISQSPEPLLEISHNLFLSFSLSKQTISSDSNEMSTAPWRPSTNLVRLTYGPQIRICLCYSEIDDSLSIVIVYNMDPIVDYSSGQKDIYGLGQSMSNPVY